MSEESRLVSRVVAEQIDYWQYKRVSIADAAIAMGHLPPKSWDQLAMIVAKEFLAARAKVGRRRRW